MKAFSALLLCVFLPLAALADPPDAATAAYDAGDLETAARLFAEAADAAPHSVSARYNLGNACFRLGRLPEALQAYRSAQMLAPRDPAVRRNLALAAAAAGVPLPEPSGIRKVYAVFSARELATLLRIGYLALAAFLLLAYALPAARRAFLWLAVPAALAAAFALAGLATRAAAAKTPEMILSEATAARSAPLADATTLATLPAGTFVEKLDARGGWLDVRTGEVVAWVPADRTLPVPR
jgi:tetratricopeptide (TPR) repeat protein